ncbi:hypothetical protein [Mycolicibacterium vulneris]|uniref:hypothetical protein n=1 Tax=Mycolicibacterium vulneris TaxID=547163 RepID=UPI0013FE328D|nr:hypothetical protein [Mycolicibacterium vulneris]
MIIEGTVNRRIANREVAIPFLVDTVSGNWFQWGHDTMTLGENVELLEALRDTACEII